MDRNCKRNDIFAGLVISEAAQTNTDGCSDLSLRPLCWCGNRSFPTGHELVLPDWIAQVFPRIKVDIHPWQFLHRGCVVARGGMAVELFLPRSIR